MRSAKCVMVVAAHKIWKRRKHSIWFLCCHALLFHIAQIPAMQLKRVITAYEIFGIPITLYNPFNLFNLFLAKYSICYYTIMQQNNNLIIPFQKSDMNKGAFSATILPLQSALLDAGPRHRHF